MADDPDSFQADVNAWVKETPERILAVFRQSTQEVASKAANGVPVDTGFARASIRASTSAMPIADQEKPKDGGSFPLDFSNITLTIANAQLNDTIFIGWSARYAIYLEFGHSSQAPSGFVRIAAEQWPQIVANVSARLKTESLGTL